MSQLISIIVPVYNVEAFIEKCMNSVFEQKYKDLDIIIVDDGSTDNSGKICDSFAKKDKRVRTFHKKNGGLSSARNLGIKEARGDLIAFVDSDDYLERDYIEKMYKKIIQTKSDIVVCGYNGISFEDGILSGYEATIKLLTKQDNIDVVAWNKLYKRKLFVDNDIYFPEGENHEDALTTYKIMSKAKKVVYMRDSLYNYVSRDNSITKVENIEERLVARKKAAKESIEFFENNIKLKKAAEISLLLAMYAFLDFAIAGKIDMKYKQEATAWIMEHKDDFSKNMYLTPKLRFYNFMSTNFGGVFYFIFRKIIN